jgi:hypothetical protein
MILGGGCLGRPDGSIIEQRALSDKEWKRLFALLQLEFRFPPY